MKGGYWIGDVGPFHYGAAVTAFFCGDDLADNVGDGLLLMRRLANRLFLSNSILTTIESYVTIRPSCKDYTSKSKNSQPMN